MSTTHAAIHEPAAAPAYDEASLPARLADARRLSLLVGVGGLVLWFVAAFFVNSLYAAYLVAYVFVLGFGVGSLAILMVHHLVGGAWGFAIRRPLEAAIGTLPLMALLFIPIVLGMHSLYPWTNPDEVRASPIIQSKAGYLNTAFFLARALVYLGLWNGLAFLLRRNSAAQDATTDPAPSLRSQTIAAPGLVALFLSVTFAAIDWMMSIEPEWYSTIYGVMVLIGWVLSALCAMIITAALLTRVRDFPRLAKPGGFIDLGNLTLAFVMLWAYMSFSQYLIIWSGNLAEELPFYMRRTVGGWRWMGGMLMAFHFFVPFFCLLIRENKRQSDRLWRVAVAILVTHLINDAWLIMPAYTFTQWPMVLGLAPALLGVGGLWLTNYLRLLTTRPLVPRNDPVLAAMLSHHAGGP